MAPRDRYWSELPIDPDEAARIDTALRQCAMVATLPAEPAGPGDPIFFEVASPTRWDHTDDPEYERGFRDGYEGRPQGEDDPDTAQYSYYRAPYQPYAWGYRDGAETARDAAYSGEAPL